MSEVTTPEDAGAPDVGEVTDPQRRGWALMLALTAIQGLSAYQPQFILHRTAAMLWRIHSWAHPVSSLTNCLVIAECLGALGVAAEPVPVLMAVCRPSDLEPIFITGRPDPTFKADGTFDGYVVLHLPAIQRFIDPTAPDLPVIHGSRLEDTYVQAPTHDALERDAVVVDRGDLIVVYTPVRSGYRQRWIDEFPPAKCSKYRQAGTALAAQVVDALRWRGAAQAVVTASNGVLAEILGQVENAPLVVTSEGGPYFSMSDGSQYRIQSV